MIKFIVFLRTILLLGIITVASADILAQSPVKWRYSWPKKNEEGAGYERITGIKYRMIFKSVFQTDKYHHHPAIAFYNSTLFASWSSSAKDEDSPGQCVWYSFSNDESNRKWADPAILFPSMDNMQPRNNPGRVLTPLGFCKVDDLIYAIAEVHDWLEGGDNNRKQDGKGKIIRSINTEGQLGEIFWLNVTPPDPVPGFPEYPNAWDPQYSSIAEKIRNWLDDPMHAPPWEFMNHTTRPKALDGHQMCEMTRAVILPNGDYIRMYRDCSGRLRNYVQTSRDKGKSWDKAVSTNIPDSNSKTYLGMLPDSTIYMINNAIDELGQRDPLSIAILDDENQFSWVGNIKYDAPRIKFEGAHKEPGFQYPSAVATEKYLWVIYSVGKEDIEVARIPLTSLPGSKK